MLKWRGVESGWGGGGAGMGGDGEWGGAGGWELRIRCPKNNRRIVGLELPRIPKYLLGGYVGLEVPQTRQFTFLGDVFFLDGEGVFFQKCSLVYWLNIVLKL